MSGDHAGAKAGVGRGGARGDMGQQRIILVSQCDADRALLQHLLTEEGFRVECVTEAAATVAAAQGLTNGLVILDTLSWQGGALNTLTALKRHPDTCHAPVLIFGQPRTVEEVTSAAQTGAAAWCDRRGFALPSFIAKVKALAGDGDTRKAPSSPAPAAVSPSAHGAEELERLTESRVREVLSSLTEYTAFEFSVIDAITSTSTKHGAEALIAEIVEHDPMLTLATLSWAAQHSAHGGCRTTDTREALALLGNREFYRRVEGVTPLKFDNSSIWDPGAFWLHSVATARIAAMLSKSLGLGVPGEAFNAGILTDIGYYVLATHFPRYFGRLFTVGGETDSIPPKWEEDLIGADHGRVGAWTLAVLGLPETLQEVVRTHHAAAARQSLSHGSQVLTLLTQAAGQLADALFPGDPPLSCLAPLSAGFCAALDGSDAAWDQLLAQARALMTDLLTEMAFLLPQARNRSYYYKQKPLGQVVYHAPRHPPQDLVRPHVATRAEKVLVLQTGNNGLPDLAAPLVINLTHLPDVNAQVEVLTSLLAVGLLTDRRTVVLLPEPPRKVLIGLVPDTTRLIAVPAHAVRWLKWLAEPVVKGQALTAKQLAPV